MSLKQYVAGLFMLHEYNVDQYSYRGGILMSMEMDMVFDGRAGDPNVLNDAARKKIAAFLVDRIGDFRCPDHQKAPTVKVTGTSLEDVTFDVTACCSKCIQMTEDKLSE